MDFSSTLHSIHINAANFSLICLSINVLLCALSFKKLAIPFQRFFYFLILNWMIEIFAIAFTSWKINNLPLLHLYTLGEFILLSHFYKSIISKPKIFRKKYSYYLLVGVLFILLNSLLLQSIFTFNSFAKTFVQLSIICYAVLYFYDLIENQAFEPIVAKSLRLINSAIMIYYSGSFFIFMCSQFSFDNAELYDIFWAFNAVLNFIFQLLIFWGLWKVIFRKVPLSS